MEQKEMYSVCVLADTQRLEDVRNKYSFINELNDGTFQMVGQNNNPDFFIIDIDMPFKSPEKLDMKIATNIEKCFFCRPIIFVNTERDQDDCPSKKILKMLPCIRNFCDTPNPCCESIPYCKSICDLKKTLNWFRFIFKHDGFAASSISEKGSDIKQIFERINIVVNLIPQENKMIKQLIEYNITSLLDSEFRL